MPLLNWLRLPAPQRRLLLWAVVTLIGVRCLLVLLPFRRLAALIERRVRSVAAGTYTPEQVAWAVRAVARYVPRANCLPQALAAQWLLGRLGHASSLRLGVTKGLDQDLKAHAWLEYQGHIIIGGEESGTIYQAFPPLNR
jgi:hypothetical protein